MPVSQTSGAWVCALKKASTWRTAVSVNTTNTGILFTEFGGSIAKPARIVDDSISFRQPEYSLSGEKIVDIPVAGFFRFHSPIWVIIANVMGDDTVGANGSDYNHVFDWQNSIAGFFTTLVGYDGNRSREVPTIKWGSFTIKGSANAGLEFTAVGIGNNVLYTGQINSGLGSVTYLTKQLIAPYDIDVRINDQSGGSLGSGDVIYANDFELSADRKLQRDVTTSGALWETDEPFESGFPEINLKLNFNQEQENYTHAEAAIDWAAHTAKKLDLTVTGDATGNGNNYALLAQIPRLIITNADSDPERGNQRVKQSLEFTAEKPQSAPTGMSGVSSMMRLTLTNTYSTAYDA